MALVSVGSHSCTLLSVAWLATTWDGVRVWVPLNVSLLTLLMPMASRVADDVAGDVGLLELVLGRGHLDRLHDGRVDRTDDDGHEGPQPHSQDGQSPPPPADVDEEDHRGQERDPEEQRQRRKAGVHVGVPGTLHVAVLGQVEVVAGQDVPGRLDERHAGEEHRQVHLDLRGDAGRARLHPDPAVEVVAMTVKTATTTSVTKAQLTMKDRNGSLKTKNPTFFWNWGSTASNDPPLVKRRKLRHCPSAPVRGDEGDHHRHDAPYEDGTRRPTRC